MGAETGERPALQEPREGRMDSFTRELRELINRYITPASTFEDYVWITAVLEEEKERLDKDAEKFLDADVNGHSP